VPDRDTNRPKSRQGRHPIPNFKIEI
jgi:hypothetical protein